MKGEDPGLHFLLVFCMDIHYALQILHSKSLFWFLETSVLCEKVQMIDILLKYVLWYEFLYDLDAQSDFDKIIVTKKPVK